MGKFIKIAIVITATIGLCACETGLFGEVGNGVSVNQEIEVEDFDRISVCSYVDVYYTQTPDQQSVTLTCDENLVEYYKIEVKNGELIVDCKRAFYNKIDTYVTVCSPAIKEITLSGSGDLYIDEALTTDDSFTLESSGSGDAEIGKMTVSSAKFKTSGSGDIEANEVTAESISVKTTGSGDCHLDCKDSGTLSVEISGSGDVSISGTARAIVDISLTGSGDFDMSGLVLSGE